MAEILLYRRLPTKTGIQAEIYWSTDNRTTVRYDHQTDADIPAYPAYEYPKGAKVDSWCEHTTRVDVLYVGAGAVTKDLTYNSPLCALPPCGLSITHVEVEGEELSGPNATATIYTNGGGGTLEYSLNNFTDIQSSNIFTGLSIGSYVAYVRPVGNTPCTVSYPFEVRPNWQVRWRLEHPTRDGIQARIDIEDRSYTGDVTMLLGTPNYATLEYPAIGNKYDTLGGSGLTIEFLHNPSLDLTDFYTADERKFRVTLYENDILQWRGYLLPEWYEEPWIAKESKPTVRIVASDGIAALRDVYYVVENGLRYYGRATQLEVLRRCLDKLDLDLPFYTAINIWADGMDTTIDPLQQAYVEQSGYYDGTTPLGCGDVLERILNPYLAFVRQQGGAIHVIPHQSRKDVYTRRRYTAKGTFEIEEPYEQVSDILRHPIKIEDVSYRTGAQVVTVEPAITLGKTELEYGELKSFVENGDFEDWNGNTPNNWAGDAEVLKALTEDGESFRLQLSKAFAGESIASTHVPYAGINRGMKFTFDWELIFNHRTTNAYIKVSLEIGGKFVYQDVDGNIKLSDTEHLWTPVYVPIENEGYAERKSVKGTFETPVFGVASEGTVQVRFYHPLSNAGTGGTIDLFVDKVRVEPWVVQQVKKMVIEGTNPGYNTVKPFELTLHHGSGIPQSEALITLQDFTPTDLWNGQLLQEHTLREILFQHSYPTRILNATITRGNAIGVLRDPHMATARFGVDGYTLDHRTGLAQVIARELFGNPEQGAPTFGFYTEDEKPVLTENYKYISIKI